MSLDLTFLFSHFSKLPNTYLGFKKLIKSNFKFIFDTKYIFEKITQEKDIPSFRFIGSTLNNLYPVLKDIYGSNVLIDENNYKTNKNFLDENPHYHNAGYDALITGKIFLFLKSQFNKDIFEFYANKIYLLYSHYKCFDIDNNSENEELLYNNSSIFCLKPFKRNADKVNICNLIGEDIYNKCIKKEYTDRDFNIIIVICSKDYENEFVEKIKLLENLINFHSFEEFKKMIKAHLLKPINNII